MQDDDDDDSSHYNKTIDSTEDAQDTAIEKKLYRQPVN